MADPLVIGVDLGTSSAKAAAYNLAGHKIAGAEVPYPTYSGAASTAAHDPDDWLSAVSEALRMVATALGEQASAVEGIGLSAHAPAVVPVSADGTPLLSRVPIWRDTRCLEAGHALLNAVGTDHAWTGPGTVLTGHYPRLGWLADTMPQVIQQAHWLLAPKDLIGLWLTGAACSDPSSGAGDRHWRADLLAASGIPSSMLPVVVNPTTVTGYLLPAVAQFLGLPAGLPVITGLNDGAAAAVATGARTAEDVIITLGTNGVVRRVITSPPAGEFRVQSEVFCWPYVDDLWIIGGHTRIGARVLTWLADLLGNSDAESIVALAAAAPPGADGVTCLPYFMGRGTPYNDAQPAATMHGLTLSTGRSSLCRAVIEGLVFALDEVLQSLPAEAIGSVCYRVTGGGARSLLWPQVMADVFGASIYSYGSQAALGAALIASVGIGLYHTVSLAQQAMVWPDQVFEPVPAHYTAYRAVQARYQTLRDTMYASRHHR